MARMFPKLPVYALYCRNVEGLHLQNIAMYSTEAEKRPPMAFDRVNTAELVSIKGEVRKPGTPLVHFRNSNDIVVSSSRSLGMTNVLFEVEENTVRNLRVWGNFLQGDQKEIVQVAALPDGPPMEHFETDIKYSVEQGEKIQGFAAHDLRTKPLAVDLEITKRGPLQLCLLILNGSAKPEKVVLKYEGMTQEYTVSWGEWGWAPISLLKEYDNNTRVRFEVSAVDKNAIVKVAKMYVRYQNIKKTD
jgi:hypothetical protein